MDTSFIHIRKNCLNQTENRWKWKDQNQRKIPEVNRIVAKNKYEQLKKQVVDFNFSTPTSSV